MGNQCTTKPKEDGEKGQIMKKLYLGGRQITQIKFIDSGTYGQVYLCSEKGVKGFQILK